MWKATFIFIARFGCGGIVGYATPRFLIGLGVPIDDWIDRFVAVFKTPPVWLNHDSIYWFMVVLLGIFIIFLTYFIPYLLSKRNLNSKDQNRVYLQGEERNIQKDMQIWEAVEYIRNVIGDDDEHGCYKRTQLEIRKAALDGKIKIYGKKELKSPSHPGHCSEVHTEIDKKYWHDHKLNSMATGQLFENDDHTWSEPHQTHGYNHRYWNLLLNSNEIKAVWPTQETSAATPKPKDSEYISLDDAAIRAYEEGRNTILATAAETATDNYQPNPKKYFSNWLIGTYENSKMKVYGCKHQLNIREEIPHSELYSNELKYNDKKELVLQDKIYKHTKYHKLCVKRKELEARLTEIQERF